MTVSAGGGMGGGGGRGEVFYHAPRNAKSKNTQFSVR